MADLDLGRFRESDPLALRWFQSEGRTIFVRPRGWDHQAGVPGTLAEALLRARERGRDMAVLATLGQHHYLTTGHIEALFFRTARRAQRRMHKLEAWQLVARWHQMEPRQVGGWRRHKDVFLLTARGASLLAHYLRTEPRPLIRRAFSAFHYALHVEHALGALDFFASLVHASRDLPDEGLYHWLGDDGVRRALEERDPELAPDGWGRYLTAGAEIGFHLEWDQGTETPQRLRAKARAAVAAGAGHVLWVAPWPAREQTIRAALTRVGGDGPAVFRTTNARLLRELGPLGHVWKDLGVGRCQRLTDLPGLARTELQVEDCLGKPGWWERRPGGTEGM
jgi:hypothetical protein